MNEQSPEILDTRLLKSWIGKMETRNEFVSATSVQGLLAMLDRDSAAPSAGDLAPSSTHWLYWFTPMARQSALGPDGHPLRGGFLPPVPLPRRMWAGSRLTVHEPLRVGDTFTRRSRVADVSSKRGRSGPLVFVQVHHELSIRGSTALLEEQDIVYRNEPGPGEASPAVRRAPEASDFARTIVPDTPLLFRYSALTHNAHRIHYDRDYATRAEGYPGLVVHGPLIATLMLDLLEANLPTAMVASFEFRAVKPLFDLSPFKVCGRREADGQTVRLWAQDHAGALAMDATARLR